MKGEQNIQVELIGYAGKNRCTRCGGYHHQFIYKVIKGKKTRYFISSSDQTFDYNLDSFEVNKKVVDSIISTTPQPISLSQYDLRSHIQGIDTLIQYAFDEIKSCDEKMYKEQLRTFILNHQEYSPLTYVEYAFKNAILFLLNQNVRIKKKRIHPLLYVIPTVLVIVGSLSFMVMGLFYLIQDVPVSEQNDPKLQTPFDKVKNKIDHLDMYQAKTTNTVNYDMTCGEDVYTDSYSYSTVTTYNNRVAHIEYYDIENNKYEDGYIYYGGNQQYFVSYNTYDEEYYTEISEGQEMFYLAHEFVAESFNLSNQFTKYEELSGENIGYFKDLYNKDAFLWWYNLEELEIDPSYFKENENVDVKIVLNKKYDILLFDNNYTKPFQKALTKKGCEIHELNLHSTYEFKEGFVTDEILVPKEYTDQFLDTN